MDDTPDKPLPDPWMQGIVAAVLLAWVVPGLRQSESALYQWLGIGAALLALSLSLNALYIFSTRFRNARKHIQAQSPKDELGSAHWATTKDIRKAGLHKPHGLFFGLLEDGTPIFYETISHGLTLAPSGAGKTISFVLPALAHDPTPMVITDLKKELYAMTADVRARVHGHKILRLNPRDTQGFGTNAYNPLQILLDDAQHSQADLISDARSMALQLHAEPENAGANKFFRDGARQILTFCFVWLAVRGDEPNATLGEAYRLVTSPPLLEDALKAAQTSFALRGDVASLAHDLSALAFGDNQKIFEDFRQGALQSLAPFNPSGWLAPVTERCDFRFADLKGSQPISVYLMCEPSSMAVFAPWVGLISWAAITELTRYGTNKRVRFLLDEATNYRIEGLPNVLTALRGYGVSVHLVVQELKEIERVYGRAALHTILSQTDIKQVFGVSSLETAEMLARLLGEKTIATTNYNLGDKFSAPVSESVGRQSRALLTADEIRRLPKEQQLLFIGNLSAIKAYKLGYHQVRPWASWVADNPLHGGTLTAPIEMVLRYG